jgi:hypothetical protein
VEKLLILGEVKGLFLILLNVFEKLDGYKTKSNLLLVTEESLDFNVSFTVAKFPRFQQKEETTVLDVRRDSVNTAFPPACNLLSSSGRSDEICSIADSESQEPDLANLADLLDMSYCNSLMIIPPDSSDDGDSMHGP